MTDDRDGTDETTDEPAGPAEPPDGDQVPAIRPPAEPAPVRLEAQFPATAGDDRREGLVVEFRGDFELRFSGELRIRITSGRPRPPRVHRPEDEP